MTQPTPSGAGATPETSALDGLLDYVEWNCDVRNQTIEAARSELVALRERVKDLEMMLHGVRRNYNEDGAAIDSNGVGWFWRRCKDDSWTALAERDSTGLPVLTPAARSALKKEKQDG